MVQAKDYSKKTHSAYYEVIPVGDDGWTVRVYAYSGGLVAEESGRGSAEKTIKTMMAKHKRAE